MANNATFSHTVSVIVYTVYNCVYRAPSNDLTRLARTIHNDAINKLPRPLSYGAYQMVCVYASVTCS